MHLHLDEDRTVELKNDPLANRTQYAFIGDRRCFLTVSLAALAASTSVVRAFGATQSAPGSSTDVSIENFSAAGKSIGIVRVAKLIETEAQWRDQLSAP
jgi:hypothetical protein